MRIVNRQNKIILTAGFLLMSLIFYPLIAQSTNAILIRPSITSPSTSNYLINSTVTFVRNTGSGISRYNISVGTTRGGKNLYNNYLNKTSVKLTNIPINGSNVYVRLGYEISNGKSKYSNVWQYKDYIYKTAKAAVLLSPAAGQIVLSPITFKRDAGINKSSYFLLVGNTPDSVKIANNKFLINRPGLIFASYPSESQTVSIPDGVSKIWVRLLSYKTGTDWQYRDYSFDVAKLASVISPDENDQPNSDAQMNFVLDTGTNLQLYGLTAGTAPGLYDIGWRLGYPNTKIQQINIPKKYLGSAIYVTLQSFIKGQSTNLANKKSYVYQTIPAPVENLGVRFVKPVPVKEVLTTNPVIIKWNAGNLKVDQYWLTVTDDSGNVLYNQAQWSKTEAVLKDIIPINGRPVTLRLEYQLYWQIVRNFTQVVTEQYNTEVILPKVSFTSFYPNIGINPVTGRYILTKDNIELRWTSGGVQNITEYWMAVKNANGRDLYSQSQANRTVVTLNNVIPIDGTTKDIHLVWTKAGQEVRDKPIIETVETQLNEPAILSEIQQVTPSELDVETQEIKLKSKTMTFEWNDIGAEQYALAVGTTAESVSRKPLNGVDSLYFRLLNINIATVSGIPQDGSNIYVRLWSKVNGAWGSVDYIYKTYDQAAEVLVVEGGAYEYSPIEMGVDGKPSKYVLTLIGKNLHKLNLSNFTLLRNGEAVGKIDSSVAHIDTETSTKQALDIVFKGDFLRSVLPEIEDSIGVGKVSEAAPSYLYILRTLVKGTTGADVADKGEVIATRCQDSWVQGSSVVDCQNVPQYVLPSFGIRITSNAFFAAEIKNTYDYAVLTQMDNWQIDNASSSQSVVKSANRSSSAVSASARVGVFFMRTCADKIANTNGENDYYNTAKDCSNNGAPYNEYESHKIYVRESVFWELGWLPDVCKVQTFSQTWRDKKCRGKYCGGNECVDASEKTRTQTHKTLKSVVEVILQSGLRSWYIKFDLSPEMNDRKEDYYQWDWCTREKKYGGPSSQNMLYNAINSTNSLNNKAIVTLFPVGNLPGLRAVFPDLDFIERFSSFGTAKNNNEKITRRSNKHCQLESTGDNSVAIVNNWFGLNDVKRDGYDKRLVFAYYENCVDAYYQNNTWWYTQQFVPSLKSIKETKTVWVTDGNGNITVTESSTAEPPKMTINIVPHDRFGYPSEFPYPELDACEIRLAK